ncbi:O-antigen ligase family protein [Uliginosibacterium sp. H1]|uniref:O-antigen ligase family protein n=1 Tax=Uliginosibacterium sp. H1 TaxID=3114757 RepID=UPI002E192A86|nr:O-antigen ligase family protein [Uliginosibacterium sp. H1]
MLTLDSRALPQVADEQLGTWQRRLLLASAIFAGLAIPLSTAAQNISTGFLLLCCVFMRPLRMQLPRLVREPFPLACLSLFLLMTVALAWSSASWDARLEMLPRFREYLLVPVFMACLLHAGARRALVISFAAATFLSVLMSFGLSVMGLHFLNTLPAQNSWPVFHSHTYHNLFIAWLGSGILAALCCKALETPLQTRLAWTALALCVANAYFWVVGRTGQGQFLLMLLFILVRHQPRRWLVPGIVALVALPVLLYLGSAHVRKGITNMQQDIVQMQAGNSDTSIGLRILYARSAVALIGEAPVFGHGTGAYPGEYARLTGYSKGNLSSGHPHNDYLWLWAEAGILGPLALLGVLIGLVLQARKLPRPQQLWVESLALCMGVGTLLHALFTDNVSGVGFAVLASALSAGALTSSPPRPVAGTRA